MAWRIEENVVRGEIDNRTKGMVRGRIWLNGWDQPLVLDLKGNGMPDLAGCFLAFKNPNATIPLRKDQQLNPVQNGSAGDLTASRKVRVPDVPIEEFIDWDESKGPPPEHLGNCLYLEWFSEANGRVVIEGTDWPTEISAPEWRMTPQENEQRAREASAGMSTFMERLSAAVDKHKRGQKDPAEKWDEHDYERFLRECDARNKKYGELLEKYGTSDEAQEKIDEAMGWNREPEEENEFVSAEDMEAICEEAGNPPQPDLDPLREGIDWIKTEHGEVAHPVQHRCHESALRFWEEVDEHCDLEKAPEPVQDFIFEWQTTAAKLAGALNSVAENRVLPDAAFTVAYLKRALGHLHQALAALESPETIGALPNELVSEARKELFAIRQEILRLMEEFRGQIGGER
jgi:hypothetical protein